MPSRADWNAKHRNADRAALAADDFLRQALAHLPPNGPLRAVDVASGGGRHGIVMAQRGLRTVAVDYSIEGLRLCRQRAAALDVELEALCLDLEAPGASLGSEAFDFVAVFNFLHRPLIPALKRCVRQGGIVAYKTFTEKQASLPHGPSDPRFLLGDGELAALFADFRQLLYLESCEPNATAGIVAQRP